MGQLGSAEVGLPAHRLVGFDGPLAARSEHREAVVLARYLDLPGLEVLDRVVRAAMTEAHLVGVQADRATEQLMAEADPEQRHAADEPAQLLDDVGERRRIAGAVGDEHAIGRLLTLPGRGEQLGGAHRAGVHPQAGATSAQVGDDRALDPGVDHGDRRAVRAAGRLERESLAWAHLARQVAADGGRVWVENPIDAFRQQLRQPSNEMPPYEPGVVSRRTDGTATIRATIRNMPACTRP